MIDAASAMPLGMATSAWKGPTGLGGHRVVGPGHDHLALRHRVLAPLVLARRAGPR